MSVEKQEAIVNHSTGALAVQSMGNVIGLLQRELEKLHELNELTTMGRKK